MNKHGYGQKLAPMQTIDGHRVDDLILEYGSPLFVFSESRLRDTVRRAKMAFDKRYPDVQFAWSYKTNYLRAICAIMHDEGSIAEVVSDFEYEKARNLGVEGSDIIYNGPYKSRASLVQAAKEGAKIQIDHLDELMELEKIANEIGIKIKVGIRLYLDAGIRPIWTKFGFNLDDGEAWRTILRIQSGGKLQLVGLHTHIGTFILEADAYRIAAEKLVLLAEKIYREFGDEITYLNLGGGFASRSSLHGSYLPSEDTTPTFDDYAEAISQGILNNLPAGRKPPKLYLESGRALVDESGYLITSVVATKRAKSTAFSVSAGAMAKGITGRSGVNHPGLLVDAGVHLLYTATWFKYKIRPTREVNLAPQPTTLFGCLCMNIDVIREALPMPPLEVGDSMVIHPVGAYNVTQSMQFIAYRPRIILLSEDGNVDIIREKEDLAYVERMERLPSRLELK
jgi:diaminopimelate decarboxylase